MKGVSDRLLCGTYATLYTCLFEKKYEKEMEAFMHCLTVKKKKICIKRDLQIKLLSRAALEHLCRSKDLRSFFELVQEYAYECGTMVAYHYAQLCGIYDVAFDATNKLERVYNHIRILRRNRNALLDNLSPDAMKRLRRSKGLRNLLSVVQRYGFEYGCASGLKKIERYGSSDEKIRAAKDLAAIEDESEPLKFRFEILTHCYLPEMKVMDIEKLN
ncbi:unnamed protein product [Cylicocyclus nassatus]|uniref:Uncharacterized protein n=1 Tax=Cylicocyclus nassatus TaxID=53992 RepID=A0AA36HFT1_CYLNA|nr:unnamed protein product [Cylicocyclus nassatus]